MDFGRILAGILVIVGIVILARKFYEDVEENRPPPTQYILFHDARVNPAKDGLVVTNKNDFPWPNPVFTINGAYHHDYAGVFRPGQTENLPYTTFKDDQGDPFPTTFQFHNFDIRTATMAMKKR